jgi:hypothetical protein
MLFIILHNVLSGKTREVIFSIFRIRNIWASPKQLLYLYFVEKSTILSHFPVFIGCSNA